MKNILPHRVDLRFSDQQSIRNRYKFDLIQLPVVLLEHFEGSKL